MQKMKYVILSTLFLSLGMFTSCNKSTIDIMIVGVHYDAEFDEINILVDSLKNKKVEKIDNLNFYIGNIASKRVVIAETPVRMSAAAMTTTIGIKQYSPKYVISEGSSGGHHDQIHVNDIVLGKDILDIASFKGPADDPSLWEGQYNGLQQPPLHSNPKLLEAAKSAHSDYVGNVKDDGIISSSDCWNKGIGFVNKLHDRYNDDCEEMEAYAVASVCEHYEIPMLAIRAISNNLTLPSPEGDFDPEVSQNAQHYILEVIEAI